MDTAKVLEDAADLLLVHGRCHYHGHNEFDGSFCLVGALAEAVQPGWWVNEPASYFEVLGAPVARAALEALAPRVAPELHARFPHLADDDIDPVAMAYTWNDATDDDDLVRDLLLLAAKDCKRVEDAA